MNGSRNLYSVFCILDLSHQLLFSPGESSPSGTDRHRALRRRKLEKFGALNSGNYMIVIKILFAFVNCIELTVFWQTDGNNTSLLQTALSKAYGRSSLMSPSLDSVALKPTLILSLHLDPGIYLRTYTSLYLH